jgi:methylmalonyl-CoA mutase
MNRTPEEPHLFTTFPPVSKARWQEQVVKDLKGKEISGLYRQTEEGLSVAPYYTAEDLAGLPLAAIQSARKQGAAGAWQNREWIVYSDEKATRQQALNALQKGANALLLDLSEIDVTPIHFARLLEGIRLTDTPVTFRTRRQSEAVETALRRISAYHLKGGLDDDRLAWQMLDGGPAPDWSGLADQLRRTHEWPAFRPLTVSSHPFHEAGAHAAQELAFTLASAVTYLDKLTDEGLDVAQVLKGTEFSISVGTHYLMEIAKFRALRYLFGKIRESYGDQAPTPVWVHARTSRFYLAVPEPYTNLLRLTTEAMAAVTGGCDALTVLPYDSAAGTSSAFSQRISRNVSTILKEEAYLDQVNDPAAGSYYLENLTYELATKAWKLFLEVEARGGLIPAFEQGWILQEIERNYQHLVTQLKAGEKTMVGVNKYRIEPTAVSRQTREGESPSSGSGLLPVRRLSEVMEPVSKP